MPQAAPKTIYADGIFSLDLEMERTRFGIEVEIHNINFILGKGNFMGREFWPFTSGSSMTNHEPLLVPLLPGGHTFDRIASVPWQEGWGFLVCEDHYQSLGPDGNQTATCVFELNTSAIVMTDVDHWIFSRRAIRAFRDSLNGLHSITVLSDFSAFDRKWYSIDKLISKYNSAVDGLPNPVGYDLNRWKLKLSRRLLELKAHDGGGWEGFVAVADGDVRNCDGQINYQLDLDQVVDGIDPWTASWKHIWIERFALSGRLVDPPSGATRATNVALVMRNAYDIALWKAARASALAFIAVHQEPFHGLPADQKLQLEKHVAALITIILACAAIVPGAPEGGTTKNYYSQLPKTSPASIARKIIQIFGDPIAVNLAQYATHHKKSAALAALKALRQPAAVNPHVPAGPPIEGLPDYTAMPDSRIFAGEIDDTHFMEMWDNVFSKVHELTAANKFGYTPDAPFYCTWALGHTAVSAEVYQGDRIKVVFESRYGTNRLNLGFNPDAQGMTFFLAYKSLLEAQGVSGVEVTALTAKLLASGLCGTQTQINQLNTDLANAQTGQIH